MILTRLEFITLLCKLFGRKNIFGEISILKENKNKVVSWYFNQTVFLYDRTQSLSLFIK